MINRIESDDGQDFILQFGEGTGGIGIATRGPENKTSKIEYFTIEEAQVIISVMLTAIDVAKEELEVIQNGH